MPKLLLGEVSPLEGDVRDAAVGEQGVPGDLRRIRVADVGIERRGEPDRCGRAQPLCPRSQ